MKEILVFNSVGENIDINIFFLKNDLHPVRSYYGLKYTIYQFKDEDYEQFNCLCDNIDEEDWDYNAWRYSKGSNVEDRIDTSIVETYINNEKIKIYYSISEMEEYIESWSEDCYMEAEEDIERIQENLSEEFLTKQYKSIFDYCREMFHCSMETNICAICTSLAKLNNITLSELFTKYAGGF